MPMDEVCGVGCLEGLDDFRVRWVFGIGYFVWCSEVLVKGF